MLINTWYVVGPSSQLREKPVHVRMLGHDFVAFRDGSGMAALLSDVCVHRGGSLSRGVCMDGQVACPYHGWRFGADGLCKHIPAQPGERIPAKARVDSYPVVERFGWLWAFLGDLPEQARPPLPDLSWVNDPTLRLVGGSFDWSANWDRVVENGLDFAHAPFVHGTSFGNREDPQMDRFDIEEDAWGARATMVMRRPLRRRTGAAVPGQHVEVITRPGFHFSGPCTTLELRPRSNWRIFIVSAHVPVEEGRTRTWWLMGRSFLKSPLWDRLTIRRNLKIFQEDHEILRHVHPERVPTGWQSEISVRSDRLQIAFREQLRALEARGWRMDQDRIDHDFKGRIASAIPSPGRALAPDKWPICPAPLVQASLQNRRN